MAAKLGYPVTYTQLEAHDGAHGEGQSVFAGLVGRVRDNGNADIMIFPPAREPRWVEDVPYGTGPHSYAQPGGEEPAPAADAV